VLPTCPSLDVFTEVVMTASFSGYAFSVKKGRGRFRSPRGQSASSQKLDT
jgi:hypothetical protein